jgi:CIC family chloride channel protein
VNSRTILPVVISSVIASNVGRYLIGPDPAFHVPAIHSAGTLDNPLVLALYFPFAALIGLFGLVFIKSIYFSEDFFEKLPLGPYTRHVLGMLILGLLFYGTYRLTGHYYIQGVGYATIEDILTEALVNPWLILALIVAKLLATTLTIGSGGSGGVFSPSLFLGAAMGGFFGTTLAALLPGLNVDPVTLALVGMASMVAATTSAPMTAAIMTYEMTLDYVVVLPIMVGVSIAYTIRNHFSKGDIYTLKLLRRGEYVPQGSHVDLYSQIVVENIMDADIEFVEKGKLVRGGECTLCVVDDNKIVGIVNPVSYRVGLEFYPEYAMLDHFLVVPPGTTVREILREIDRQRCTVAVVSVSGKLDKEGIIGVFNMIHLTRAIAGTSKMFVD